MPKKISSRNRPINEPTLPLVDLADMNVLILLSGGIDSASCVDYYLSQGYKTSALFINYGQTDAEEEQLAASAISAYYKTSLDVVSISQRRFSSGYIPARNAMLLSLALMNFKYRSGIVSLGIHSGTAYADCSSNFVLSMQNIYALYEEGRIRIDAPFLKFTKTDIWKYAQSRNVPVHLTHSSNEDDISRISRELGETK